MNGSIYTEPTEEVIDAYPGLMTEEGDGVIIPTLPPLDALAQATGDVSGFMDAAAVMALGADVVADYQRDRADRREWEIIAKEALKLASQEATGDVKTYPWRNCANVNYPMLTTAALQFNARAYPAIVKGDEAVLVKVVGKDKGRPQLGPDGKPLAQAPDGQVFTAAQVQQFLSQIAAEGGPEAAQQASQSLQVAWKVAPGAKAARAVRVSDYMNTTLFYRMDDWEADTDTLLMQLPIVGCVFRKVWWDAEKGKQCAAMVPALRIIVPEGARSCETTPRLTEEIPDVYPHEIRERIRSGFYREVVIEDGEEARAGGRMLLEQHRLIDMDADGIEEPYIVTVDFTTQQVLRIEPNFGPDSVKRNEAGDPVSIERGKFYIKYDFFPHPEGKFYGVGLGHLLKQVGAVVDTAINQLIDAGTAQTAGGGFIASGVRLQGRNAVLRFEPGEYKTVETSGAELRNGIVERTLPNVSPVTFQVLDLILGAARDISGVKDVITGEASNNGQVGTTLALIEQGLQVYTAVHKRVYRSLKAEFTLIRDNLGKYGGEAAAKDYAEVLDDEQADFAADFSTTDQDIRPISDPTSATKMQQGARANALMATAQIPGANPVAILKRVYEAMGIENPEELISEPPPPDPRMEADAKAKGARATRDMAEAEYTLAETQALKQSEARADFDTRVKAYQSGHALAA